MNPKIFVGVAVAALAAILGGILTMGPSIIVETENNSTNEISNTSQAQSLQVELGDISISKISERTVTIDISFNLINPNPGAMLVQTMDYQLFETSFSESEQLSGGQIGSRPQGMVEFGSNYFTLLGENSIVLKDTITLKNSGNTPELWSNLENGNASWKVTGDVFYNFSSMTSGQENEVHFEFMQ